MKTKLLIEIKDGSIVNMAATAPDLELIIIDYDYPEAKVCANRYNPRITEDNELEVYITGEISKENHARKF